jgi:PTK7 protein tyrosine kinase 7
VNSVENYSFNHLGVNAEENNSKMTRTVTITLGAAALYMFLVMALMVYCRYKRAKRKAALVQASGDANKTENGDLEMRERNNCSTTNPEQHRLLSTADDKQKQICNKNSHSIRNEGDVHSQTSSSHSSKRSKSPYEKLQFPRQDLQKLCLLGHGEFGDVFLAKSISNKCIDTNQIVMVKALQSKDENIHLDYKREIEMFHKMNHERVVKLIGLCREIDPFLIVLEYSDWVRFFTFIFLSNSTIIYSSYFRAT